MRTIQIDDTTYQRLETHVSLTDNTEDKIVRRALDALDRQKQAGTSIPPDARPVGVLSYSDKNIPNLTHTKVTNASVGGRALPHANWNSILDEVLLAAAKSGLKANDIRAIGGVKVVEGSKLDEGFSPLRGTGLSVQGQDANRACFGALSLGKKIGLKVKIEFLWRNKEGAAFPGHEGHISNF